MGQRPRWKPRKIVTGDLISQLMGQLDIRICGHVCKPAELFLKRIFSWCISYINLKYWFAEVIETSSKWTLNLLEQCSLFFLWRKVQRTRALALASLAWYLAHTEFPWLAGMGGGNLRLSCCFFFQTPAPFVIMSCWKLTIPKLLNISIVYSLTLLTP